MEEIMTNEIGGAKVIYYTKLDDRHTRTNNTEHYIGGQILQDTVEDAKDQAEFEFTNTLSTWKDMPS